MNARTRRPWKLPMVGVVVGAALFAGTAEATPSTPPPAYISSTLGSATFGPIDSHIVSKTTKPHWRETIKTKGSSDLYVQQNTWDPRACGCIPTTGWHTHDGPSLVIVTVGTVTAYDGDDPTCTPHIYSAVPGNNEFVDPGDGHVHILRDESGAVAKTIAVQLIPSGSPRKEDVPV